MTAGKTIEVKKKKKIKKKEKEKDKEYSEKEAKDEKSNEIINKEVEMINKHIVLCENVLAVNNNIVSKIELLSNSQNLQVYSNPENYSKLNKNAMNQANIIIEQYDDSLSKLSNNLKYSLEQIDNSKCNNSIFKKI